LHLTRERGEPTLIAAFAALGVRAHQTAGRPEAAARYLAEFLRLIGPAEDIARPSILHATGLVRLAEGSIIVARAALEAAVDAWESRGRRWDALWARLDLASAHLRSNRYADAVALIREVQAVADELQSPPLADRAAQLSRIARGRGEEIQPWHPLTTREFEVARKIAEGMTNAELGDELGISPKTASSHVEHILAKLGVSRRSEIAVWASTVTMPIPAASAVSASRFAGDRR
jgi:DNA-binding CsgD family transcriptional regulator